MFAFSGCIAGALVAYGSVRLSSAFPDGSVRESTVAAGATGAPAPSAASLMGDKVNDLAVCKCIEAAPECSTP
jgi:hypothetical protein